MTEDTVVESFRLHADKVNWLNRQSAVTGKPKVYFVDQGLGIMMSAAKLSRIKTLLSLLLYCYAGGFIIVFSFLYFTLIPPVVLYMMGSLGALSMSISLYGITKEANNWRRVNGK